MKDKYLLIGWLTNIEFLEPLEPQCLHLHGIVQLETSLSCTDGGEFLKLMRWRSFRIRDFGLNFWPCYISAVHLGRWLILSFSISSFVTRQLLFLNILYYMYVCMHASMYVSGKHDAYYVLHALKVSGVKVRWCINKLSMRLNQWKLSYGLMQHLWTCEIYALILDLYRLLF